jgi:streptogramin lyase
MRRESVVLILLAALAAGCGQRVRGNPFDPANPQTGGRPAGFEALAGDGLVNLRWSATVSSGLVGYELFREAGAETTFTQISALLPPNATSFGDFQLQNGLDHRYRLYFVFARGPGTTPAEDIATPGRLTPWVADYRAGAATLLTADGRRVRSGETALGPADVAADPARDALWIVDAAGGNLDIVTLSTGRRVTVSALQSPGAIALDPVDGNAWVADGGLGVVRHYLPDGSAGSPFELNLLANPIDVAVDRGDRSLWVCERDGDRVRHYASTGSPLGAVSIRAPSRVAVDTLTHAAWVTSFTTGKVYLVSNVPALRDSFALFSGPIGAEVDDRRGRIWIADALGGTVVALRRNGSEEFRVGGFAEPREIAVDRASGEAWVTLAGSGEVVRLSPAGVQLVRTGGLGTPYGISLGYP